MNPTPLPPSPSAATPLCPRCATRPAGLSRAPFRGALGEELARRVCPACWEEWKHAEVMVINELKLNFMEPTAQEILTAHMREFLALDGPPRP
jgi:Fe-S cluster biosynthesis and repair protein YggX